METAGSHGAHAGRRNTGHTGILDSSRRTLLGADGATKEILANPLLVFRLSIPTRPAANQPLRIPSHFLDKRP